MRLPGEVDGDRFLRAMGRLGWTVARQRGSHRKLVHDQDPKILIVSFHGTLSRNSVRRILRQAGLAEEAFLSVY